MKRFALMALVLAMACGDDGGNPPVGAGTMTADVNGTSYIGSLGVAAVRSGNTLTISSASTNSRKIAINLVDVTSTGVVPAGAGNTSFAQYSEGTQIWVSSLVGGTGTVTLTTLSATHATGTFAFRGIGSPATGATGSQAVSGSFDVSF